MRTLGALPLAFTVSECLPEDDGGASECRHGGVTLLQHKAGLR